MQLPHPVHTFTYSHIHTFTHTHKHTHTHIHRDYSDYSDSCFDRKKGRIRDRGQARKSDFRYADHAYSRKPIDEMRIRGPASKLPQQKSTVQTQTLGRTSRHISPHTAQRAYMYAICNYPKHTFPPLRYQVHRQYDNLASFPRTCAVGHPSRVSQHMNVFEPVRVVTSSPCLAPLDGAPVLHHGALVRDKETRGDAKRRG